MCRDNWICHCFYKDEIAWGPNGRIIQDSGCCRLCKWWNYTRDGNITSVDYTCIELCKCLSWYKEYVCSSKHSVLALIFHCCICFIGQFYKTIMYYTFYILHLAEVKSLGWHRKLLLLLMDVWNKYSCIVKIVVADDFMAHEAMVFIYLSGNFAVFVTEGILIAAMTKSDYVLLEFLFNTSYCVKFNLS